MKTTVYFNDFYDAFCKMGRSSQFSRDALRALFDYLDYLEDMHGDDYELDVIELCCDFAEVTAREVINDYDLSAEVEDLSDDEALSVVRDYLNENGLVSEIWEGASPLDTAFLIHVH